MITQDEILHSVVRALTWKEPFASAMLEGKLNETRTWPTNIRGLVLICSARTYYKPSALLSICGPDQFRRINRKFRQTPLFTRGKAIGIARLIDCRPMKDGDQDDAFVKMGSLYIHRYADAIKIKPFPWKGTQGWTILNESQKKLIELWPS